MKRAYIGIRAEPHYRRDAFAAGLRACGYDVRFGPPQTYDVDTVYVSWNRYAEHHDYCTRLERAGGTCLVAENGYIGTDVDGRQFYALARHAHNGAGQWPSGGPERWDALGVDLKPWRADGGHILVAPNRTFGMPGLAMPLDWPARVVRHLREVTKREIRVRPHPGNDPPRRPLERDLEGCWAVVIWASSVGVKALIQGVPTIACSPFWIMKSAAGVLEQVELPPMLDRLPAFHRLSFAQWAVPEIASGKAFKYLLQTCDEMA